jgi:phage anti-repressor protein
MDVITLIENNPITTLSQTYNVKLLEKMKSHFSTFEQHLFLSSFYCYLNYHLTNDFVIDFDEVWHWLGFAQKSNAKRLLLKKFILDKDYKINKNMNTENHGGNNREIILMNIDTFKKFCLKAGTEKADEIHDYYIKMEQLIQDTINEESIELRVKLSNFSQTSEYEKRKAIESTLINQFPVNTECVYLGTIGNTNEKGEKLIKFGHTNNLAVRVADHRDKYDNFILLEAYKVRNKVEIENLIKTHPKIKNQIRNIIVNGMTKKEIIAYDENNFTINDLKKFVKDIINSRTYNIEKFNQLLEDNDKLLEEKEQLIIINQELNLKLKHYEDIITRQTIQIQDMQQEIDLKDKLLKDETSGMETKINNDDIKELVIYQNPLIPNDENTKKFDEFIDTMCIVHPEVEEASTNMEGAFRIWNKIKPKKETFHLLKTYLDTRFKPSRISNQNKNQIVHGYIGVRLKHVTYSKKYINNDVETFLFEVCKFTPSAKILNSTLLSEYQRWKQQLGKEICSDDMIKIKEYLNNCEYALKATVHVDQNSNEGYYGIQLKIDEYKHKYTSSTGKKVEKVDNKTEIVLRTWETIAKAGEDEHMSASKMSRSIKNKIIFNNDYYYRCSN